MLTVEQIKKSLADSNLKRVAENAGVHPATLYRFMQEDSNPLYETVKALSDYLISRMDEPPKASQNADQT